MVEVYDINRDRLVNILDVGSVRINQNSFSNPPLNLITAPTNAVGGLAISSFAIANESELPVEDAPVNEAPTVASVIVADEPETSGEVIVASSRLTPPVGIAITVYPISAEVEPAYTTPDLDLTVVDETINSLGIPIFAVTDVEAQGSNQLKFRSTIYDLSRTDGINRDRAFSILDTSQTGAEHSHLAALPSNLAAVSTSTVSRRSIKSLRTTTGASENPVSDTLSDVIFSGDTLIDEAFLSF